VNLPHLPVTSKAAGDPLSQAEKQKGWALSLSDIGFQDHGSASWCNNIKMRLLNPPNH
jgi:hypothetical protein